VLFCRIAPKEHLVEITDPAVDHAGVFNQDPGLAALAGVLEKFIYKQQPSAAAAAKPSKQPSAASTYKPAVEVPGNQQQLQQPAGVAAPAVATATPAAATTAAVAAAPAKSIVGKGAVVFGKGAVVTGKAAGVTLSKGPFSFTFGH
jgi:hypothetical protein